MVKRIASMKKAPASFFTHFEYYDNGIYHRESYHESDFVRQPPYPAALVGYAYRVKRKIRAWKRAHPEVEFGDETG